MELLLYRWSTAVQITSALMIAVFFGVLARSVRRVELRPWVNAWYENLAALLATVVFWLAQPNSQWAFVMLRWAYVFAKTTFVVLLVIGALRFVPDRSGGVRYGRVAAAVALYSTIAAFAIDSIDQLGFVQSATIGVCVGTGARRAASRQADSRVGMACHGARGALGARDR